MMPVKPKVANEEVVQNTTKDYLDKMDLQALLERLFPYQTQFKIQQRDDQWHFTAPRVIEEHEIESARRKD